MRTSVIKKTLLLALLLATSSAWAEWVQVAETESSNFYLDFKSVRKEGNLRTAWVLIDFRAEQAGGGMSRQVRYEYDCKEVRFNILAFSLHSGSMAQGSVLSTKSYAKGSDWNEIFPESSADAILKIVCRK